MEFMKYKRNKYDNQIGVMHQSVNRKEKWNKK